MVAAIATAIEKRINLLKQGTATGQVAKHGRRLDRRHVPRLLHRLRDGLGEHFGIVTAAGLLSGCKDGLPSACADATRHYSARVSETDARCSLDPSIREVRNIPDRSDRHVFRALHHSLLNTRPDGAFRNPADACRLRHMIP